MNLKIRCGFVTHNLSRQQAHDLMTSCRLATFPDKTPDTIQDEEQGESLEKTQVTDTTGRVRNLTGGESGIGKIGEFPWRLLAVMDCGDRF